MVVQLISYDYGWVCVGLHLSPHLRVRTVSFKLPPVFNPPCSECACLQVLTFRCHWSALYQLWMHGMCTSCQAAPRGLAWTFMCVRAPTQRRHDVRAAVQNLCFRCYGRSQRRLTVMWGLSLTWTRVFRPVCLCSGWWRWRSCVGWLPVGRLPVLHFAHKGSTARCAWLLLQ